MLQRDLPVKDEPGLIRHRLGPSKLYIDDVERIYNGLDKAAKARAGDTTAACVVITAGKGTRADLPEALRGANAKELPKVSLAIDGPVVSVDLWRRGAGVTAQSSDPGGSKLADDIRDYVREERSWASIKIFKSSSDGGLIALIVGACIAIIAPLSYFIHAHNAWVIDSASAVGLYICAILGRAYFLFLSGTVKVIPRRRSEIPSMMQRPLVVGVISAAAGAAATIFAEMISAVLTRHH
jgi:hypothetical protein